MQTRIVSVILKYNKSFNMKKVLLFLAIIAVISIESYSQKATYKVIWNGSEVYYGLPAEIEFKLA